MKTSSSVVRWGESSCSRRLVVGGEVGDPLGRQPGDGQRARRPRRPSRPPRPAASSAARGSRRAHRDAVAGRAGEQLAHGVSAIRRPRPITTRWSAVSSSSLIRWLETSTVRPSAASARRKPRIQRMPSGSSPLTGSSNSSSGGSPSSAAAMPEPLAHPEREAADAPARDARQPDELEHLVARARRGSPLLRASQSRWSSRAQAGVHRAGVEQRADLAQRALERRVRPAGDQRRARRRARRARGSSASSSTCRRRSGRRTRSRARLDGERQVVDGERRPVALGQPSTSIMAPTVCAGRRACRRARERSSDIPRAGDAPAAREPRDNRCVERVRSDHGAARLAAVSRAGARRSSGCSRRTLYTRGRGDDVPTTILLDAGRDAAADCVRRTHLKTRPRSSPRWRRCSLLAQRRRRRRRRSPAIVGPGVGAVPGRRALPRAGWR